MGRKPLLAWAGLILTGVALTGCEHTGACCGRRTRNLAEGPPPNTRGTAPPQGWADQRNSSTTPANTGRLPGTAQPASVTGAAPGNVMRPEGQPVQRTQPMDAHPAMVTMPERKTAAPLPPDGNPSFGATREPASTIDDGPTPPSAPTTAPPFETSLHQVPGNPGKPIATSEDKTPVTPPITVEKKNDAKPIAVSGQKPMTPETPPFEIKGEPPPVEPPVTLPVLTKPSTGDVPLNIPAVDPPTSAAPAVDPPTSNIKFPEQPPADEKK